MKNLHYICLCNLAAGLCFIKIATKPAIIGNINSIVTAVGNPKTSPIRPIIITTSPPKPLAKPIVNPDAKALLSGMASCAATTVTEKLDKSAEPASARKIVLNMPLVNKNPKNSGVESTSEPIISCLRPK